MENKINPITGLPVVTEVNAITGEPLRYKPQGNYVGKFTGVGFAGGTNENYGDYGIDQLAYYDKAEERAKRQTSTEKWMNGLGKAGVTFMGATLENTAGMALGIADYISSGFSNYDLAESMANNPVGIMVDKANKYAQSELPNYYTQEEMEQQGSLASIASHNFWADKFLNGAAYSLGSIASAYLTGGYGLVGGTLKATGAAAKMSRSLAAYKVAKTAKGATSVRGASNVAGALSRNKALAQSFATRLGQFEAGTMMSMAEAAVEAREAKESVRETLLETAKRRKAAITGAPDWRSVELDNKELEQINLQASEAEGAAFYGNMAVLVPTNLSMFKNILTPFKNGAGFNKIVKNAVGNTEKYVDFARTLPQGVRQAYIAGRVAAPFAKNAVEEGFQEGMQYAISQGVSDYELRKFKDSGSGELVDSLMQTGKARALLDSSGDIISRAKGSFEDKEAREQMLIGAMVGLLSGGLGGVKEVKEKNKNTKTVLDVLNDPSFYRLGKKSENLNAGTETVRKMMAAQEAGDKVTYERLQGELITQQVLHHIDMGSLDMFKERMEDAKTMSDEEFKEEFGLDPEVDFTPGFGKAEIVDRIIKQSEDILKGKQIVDSLFPSTATQGAPRLVMSKEALEEEEERIKDERIYKDFLIHNYATLKTLDREILDSIATLEGIAPGNKALKNDLKNYKRSSLLSGTPKLDELRMEFEEFSQNIEGLDKLQYNEEVDKLIGLINSKNSAELAFDNLVKSPEKRDLFVARTKIKAEQEKIKAEIKRNDEIATSKINSAVKSSDLADIIDDPEGPSKYSEEVLANISSKYRELRNLELSLQTESDFKSLQKLEEQLVNETDTTRQAILRDIIQFRRDNNIVDPPKTKEEGATITSLFGEQGEEPGNELNPTTPTEEGVPGAENFDPGTDPITTTILDILRKDVGIKLSNNGEYYVRVDENGKVIERFMRVSDMKNKVLNRPKKPMTDAQKGAAARGTIVDEMFRQAIMKYNASKDIITVEELKTIYNNSKEKKLTYEFTEEFLKDIRFAISEVIDATSKAGMTLETNFPPLFGTINGERVAGTVDFIAYNSKGDFKIIDLKTSGALRRKLYNTEGNTTELEDALQFQQYVELMDQMIGFPPNKRPQAFALPIHTPVFYKKDKNKKRTGVYKRAISEKIKFKNGTFAYTLLNTKNAQAKLLLNIQAPSPSEVLEEELSEEESLRKDADQQAFAGGLDVDNPTEQEFAQLLALVKYLISNPNQVAPKDAGSLNNRFKTAFAALTGVELARHQKLKDSQDPDTTNKFYDAYIQELKDKYVGKIIFSLVDSTTKTKTVTDLGKPGVGKNLVIANGELRNVIIDGNYKVEVDALGNFIKGNDASQLTPAGLPYLIDRNFIKSKSEEELAQLIFQFEILPTKWASENATNESNVPIGVFALNGEEKVLVGVLKAANNTDTQEFITARKELATKLSQGIKVNGNLSSVSAGNIINTFKRDSAGKPIKAFFPVKEARGTAALALTSKSITGELNIPKNLIDSLTDEQVLAIKSLTTSTVSGRVIGIIERPGAGERIGIIPMYTANVDSAAVEAVKQIVQSPTDKSNIAKNIREIVGMSQSFSEGPNFYVTDHEGIPGSTAVIYFSHHKYIVRLTNTELEKALKGKHYKFQIGWFTQQTTPEVIVKGGAEEIEEVSMVDEFGRPVIKWENALNTYMSKVDKSDPIQVEIEKHAFNEALNELKKGLLQSMEEALKARKRQVNVEQATLNNPYQSKVTGETYNSYLDYLSSPLELSGPQDSKTSILTMDTKAHNGSFYYDLKMEFSTFEDSQGPVTEPDRPTNPTPANTATQEMEQSQNKNPLVNADPGLRVEGRRRSIPRDSSEAKGEELKNQCNNQ